jgi:hypothetical protein
MFEFAKVNIEFIKGLALVFLVTSYYIQGMKNEFIIRFIFIIRRQP